MTRKTIVAALAALALALMPQAAPADQTDKQLPSLFAKLKLARSPAEAQPIEAAIWRRWGETQDDDARFPFMRGLESMEEQEFKEALRYFTEAVRRAPRFAEAWNKKATIEYLLGDYAASVASIERTLALEPRHFGALSGLGLINLQLDRDEAALKAFEAALEVHPHMAGARARVKQLKEKRAGKPT
ncbi:MAG: tetratricopeptide repeat protein [Rhodospirillales bacterium]